MFIGKSNPGAEAGTSAKRLLIVDQAVGDHGNLRKAALSEVTVVEFDSKTNLIAEVIGMVRAAHHANKKPFESIAFANHGPTKQKWVIAADLTVATNNVDATVLALAPFMETMIAALSKTALGQAHIDLLACFVAKACPKLIPHLEELYQVDFRGSVDTTGNPVDSKSKEVNWKMETDADYDVAADYFNKEVLVAYKGQMGVGTTVGGVLDFCCLGASGGAFSAIGYAVDVARAIDSGNPRRMIKTALGVDDLEIWD
jgi:hypothetical protein